MSQPPPTPPYPLLRLRSWLAYGTGLLLLALATEAAHGQTELERFQRQIQLIERRQRLEVDTDVPVDQRLYVDYGGTAGFSFLAVDDIDQNTRILRQTEMTGFGRVSVDGAHNFFARLRSTYRDFNGGESFDGRGDDWVRPRFDRLFYRLDLGRAREAYAGERPEWDLEVQAGRQYIHWGSGLVLSRVLDGGRIEYRQGPLTLTGLGGMTRGSSTDFDSSRPGFDGDTQRVFTGGRIDWTLSARHRPYVYGLAQIDENDDEALIVGSTTTRFDYESFYIGLGSVGNLSDHLAYTLELVYQGGEGLSNSFDKAGVPRPQTRERIEAFAADLRLDYHFLDANRTRLSSQLLFASGDPDRAHTSNTLGGNRPGTRDNAFNAFGLVNTGLAFAPEPSNLLMAKIGASTFPFSSGAWADRFQVGIDLFVYGKQRRHGGASEPTGDHRYLGLEGDIFFNWQLASDLNWSMRYGVFFPGKAVRAGDDSNDQDPRHFLFSGLTLTF